MENRDWRGEDGRGEREEIERKEVAREEKNRMIPVQRFTDCCHVWKASSAFS